MVIVLMESVASTRIAMPCAVLTMNVRREKYAYQTDVRLDVAPMSSA